MNLDQLSAAIADYLKRLDDTYPVHKSFQPGIGPFGEPQLVGAIADGISHGGIGCHTHRTPDMSVNDTEWALEFKIARPFGDNGKEAENWTVNLLHPYEGNVSAIGDAIKLCKLSGYHQRAIIVIGYEHQPAKIPLDPLISSFEVIARDVIGIELGPRIVHTKRDLVHPVHQVVHCYAWQVFARSTAQF
jgi:hypothetical protein